MKSIENNIENTIIINKSKFITKLYKINNKIDIINILNELKDNYKDATHICYAYIFDGLTRCTDDKEPQGTAGIPILNILEKNDLNYILCAVIRYYGGVKLGAPGLTRAYSNSAKEAVKLANIIELTDALLIKLEINYNDIKVIDNLLKNSVITYKEYNNNIIYEAIVKEEVYNNLKCKKEIIKKIKTSL